MVTRRPLAIAATIVRTVDLEEIDFGDGQPLRLRLEVARQGRKFIVRAYRRETYDLKLFAKPRKGHLAVVTESAWVVDNALPWEAIEARSVSSAIDAALELLSRQLKLPTRRPKSQRTRASASD